MTRPLTGRKVFAIAATAFAVIIGVNITMAVLAIGTFPGLEVRNSYVASQDFDRERAAQQALGWGLDLRYQSGQLTLIFRDRDGLPAEVARLTATIGRTTLAADDIEARFSYANGVFSAPAALAPGKWMVLVQAFAADGTRFHQRIDLYVKG